jgi:hypothetical protein
MFIYYKTMCVLSPLPRQTPSLSLSLPFLPSPLHKEKE